MKKISNTIMQMNLFQRIQVLSALIPYYSSFFVVVTTYIVCWKKKQLFGSFIICSFIYFILFSLTFNFISTPLVEYIICCAISLVGNYSLVSIQMKEA